MSEEHRLLAKECAERKFEIMQQEAEKLGLGGLLHMRLTHNLLSFHVYIPDIEDDYLITAPIRGPLDEVYKEELEELRDVFLENLKEFIKESAEEMQRLLEMKSKIEACK